MAAQTIAAAGTTAHLLPGIIWAFIAISAVAMIVGLMWWDARRRHH